jgi:hypothetical protein
MELFSDTHICNPDSVAEVMTAIIGENLKQPLASKDPCHVF